MPTATLKTERIDVRADSSVKQLLQAAARTSHKSVSEFLLDAGISAANQTLAERQRFELNDTEWEAFLQVLERPVKELNPKLKRLLSEKGILD